MVTKQKDMTLQQLKDNRNEIIAAITNEVGAEQVRRVMDRMILFMDYAVETCPVAYAKRTISDMQLVKIMESRDSKLTKLIAKVEQKKWENS